MGCSGPSVAASQRSPRRRKKTRRPAPANQTSRRYLSSQATESPTTPGDRKTTDRWFPTRKRLAIPEEETDGTLAGKPDAPDSKGWCWAGSWMTSFCAVNLHVYLRRHRGRLFTKDGPVQCMW
jgi:hypothetical protein